MTTISLQTALRLIRYNHADSEVANILQATLDELDRLGQIEKHAINLAQAALETKIIDLTSASEILRLAGLEVPAPPDAGEWAVMNRVAKQ